MKRKMMMVAVFLLLMASSAKAQENKQTQPEETQSTLSHRVQLGETVMLICKKYVVAPDDIYKLNPKAVDGISEGMMLTIPSEKKVAIQPKKKKPDVATIGKKQESGVN